VYLCNVLLSLKSEENILSIPKIQDKNVVYEEKMLHTCGVWELRQHKVSNQVMKDIFIASKRCLKD
jgi:hypothetical protein